MAVVKVTEVVRNIYHLRFPNAYLMNASLIRIQEHYESPRFKNKVFTLEQFMDWWAELNGKFDYFTEVRGMNFPSSVFDKFYAGKFDPLTKKERKILSYFRRKKHEFYIVATYGDRSTLNHEIAHGFYYLLPEYKEEMLAELRGYDETAMQRFLRGSWYSRALYKDEIHAYLVEGMNAIDKYGFTKKDWERLKKLSRRMRKIFRRYLSERRIDRHAKSIKF
jgi:hypothetical protein